MIKIVFLDHCFLNSKVMEQDSKAFLDAKNLPYELFVAQNCDEAFEYIQNQLANIFFIDISSEDKKWVEFVQKTNALKIEHLLLVGVTALYDNISRYEALEHKVFHFVYKPFDNKEIEHILQKYIDLQSEKIEENEEFDDFDEFDEFMDFDDETNEEHQLMEHFNQSHKKVPAKEFLASYSEDDILVDAFTDLEEDLDWLISELLFEDNIGNRIDQVIEILEQYRMFLFTFSEFDELHNVLNGIIEILQATNFDTIKNSKIIGKFIVAILQDLVEWKEHVFIVKDAVDVYYINASILSSYLQLKELTK